MKSQSAGASPVTSEQVPSGAALHLSPLASITPLYPDKLAAPILGVATPTLRKSRCTGMLLGHPAPVFIKQGRRVRYREEVLLAWLAQFQPCRNTLEAQRILSNTADTSLLKVVSPDSQDSDAQRAGEK